MKVELERVFDDLIRQGVPSRTIASAVLSTMRPEVVEYLAAVIEQRRSTAEAGKLQNCGDGAGP